MNDLRIWLWFGVLMLLDAAIETIKTYWVVFAVLAIILLALFIFLNQPVSAEASQFEVRTVETPKPELGLREQGIDGLKNMPLESKNYAKKILCAGLG